MKVMFHNIYPSLNENNKMFEDPNTAIGDNLLKPFCELAKSLKLREVEIGTSSRFEVEEADLVIFIEIPKLNNSILKKSLALKKKMFLILIESELIMPRNWDIELHNMFEKIFTWNDDFVDNKKYFKLNMAHEFPEEIDTQVFEKKKLCTMIAGNKVVNKPGELYSERRKVIDWFANEHPTDFDLYGFGWNQYYFSGIFKKLNRFSWFQKVMPYSVPKNYRGMVDRKSEVLKQYKFSICFENFTGVTGYITEKIFDCFISGNIPIYYGPASIHNYIPENCFISYTKFKNIADLYDFLNTMSKDDYSAYIRNINEFINSKKVYPFTINYFVETLSREICES